mgnify:CR=1 FL=1
MKKEELIDYIAHGREIEFKYKEKMYSITYNPLETDYYISFCECDKEPTNVKNIEELIKIECDGITILKML